MCCAQLSGVTVCAAIFPFYVFPIEAMQRYGVQYT
ncbi:hypothetical protein PF007_g12346 [Phytophthora fragariae]|uniref:Uncharacterized protein n=1 Tax=Phytophthora fragariae TaxID=53985 RepID=A0A6A3S4C2_9STRA|nr:hypothetical protein PF003_g10241 [Phytophthora fragariae]KAE8935214.1 hypothetical protein PF009_g14817 [Phytophthora fragariae]KAE9109166.1 hypothetical protein PF007_g12346 [Phytophthora fragariae]KAE9142184.1 hypothetical protein PF006_g12688 [Phytophthora fragariae]KAE9304512.1 hypothetical protein PF001_g13030 [Phytophthora fragariae]